MDRKCPYCASSMVRGTFYGKVLNYFLPDGSKNPILGTKKLIEKQGGVVFEPVAPMLGSFESDYFPEAWICRKCKYAHLPYVPEDE